MNLKFVVGTGTIAAVSLLIVSPAIAQSVSSSTRSACVQRTAEEMGVATRDLSMIEAGPVSAESGARTLVFRHSNTGQTAECRVNTIDNTVLSVTLGGMNSGSSNPAPSRPPSNSARFASLTASPGSRINVRSQPTVYSSSPSYGVPGDQVRVIQCVRDRDTAGSDLNWCKVQFAQSKAIGWVRSDFIMFGSDGR